MKSIKPWRSGRSISVVAAALLMALSPLLAVIALAVLVESGSPVLYSQIRIGRYFRRFRIYKFRSMITRSIVTSSPGSAITAAGDSRVTPLGRILRAAKLDELPQLWNVLRGDMSLVGPRPEIPQYVEAFRDRYRKILNVRPGITDLASIQFRDEEHVLALASDPLQEYETVVLPQKLDLADEYLRRRCFSLDLSILWRTAQVCVSPLLLRWHSNPTSHKS